MTFDNIVVRGRLFQVLIIYALIFGSVQENPPRPHVLLIVIDDLRPAIRSFGDTKAFTPNIDRIAKRGVRFTKAYAQQALCAPSRNSFLTSRRPDTLKLYDFYNYWRKTVGNFTTLPQYFKQYGYRTVSIGKVFHPGISSNFTDDWPYSWSDLPFHPSTERYKESPNCLNSVTKTPKTRDIVCPIWDFKELPEETLPDIQSYEKAKRLIELSENDPEPLFLAVGFHKPHIPLKFPAKFLAKYPLRKVGLAPGRFRSPGMPTIAWNPWIDLREREDVASLNLTFPWEAIPDDFTKLIRQSYYAAISYIDDLIGKLFQAVDESSRLRDNTIIILLGDHGTYPLNGGFIEFDPLILDPFIGWSLGEHGLWSKYSLFEAATRVPLIIVPLKGAYKGLIINYPVELIDIFPTLAELAKLPRPEKCPQKNRRYKTLCVEGKSLLPIILHKYQNDSFQVACSQYPRPGVYPTQHPNSDKPRLKQIRYMGYSIRTTLLRYTEWVHWDPEKEETDWSRPAVARELYQHQMDPNESINLADRPIFSNILLEMSSQLRIHCATQPI